MTPVVCHAHAVRGWCRELYDNVITRIAKDAFDGLRSLTSLYRCRKHPSSCLIHADLQVPRREQPFGRARQCIPAAYRTLGAVRIVRYCQHCMPAQHAVAGIWAATSSLPFQRPSKSYLSSKTCTSPPSYHCSYVLMRCIECWRTTSFSRYRTTTLAGLIRLHCSHAAVVRSLRADCVFIGTLRTIIWSACLCGLCLSCPLLSFCKLNWSCGCSRQLTRVGCRE